MRKKKRPWITMKSLKGIERKKVIKFFDQLTTIYKNDSKMKINPLTDSKQAPIVLLPNSPNESIKT